MRKLLVPFAILACFLQLASCGPSAGDGPVMVAIIGEEDSLLQQGIRLAPAAQHLRAATVEGLVALDPSGQIIPAIAERWIVTEDGLSYIFRLRGAMDDEASALNARSAARALRGLLRRLEGTSLGLDLAKIAEVRSMTDRVIEIRLMSPMPEFLRLLAQPEMGIITGGAGLGPMRLVAADGDGAPDPGEEADDESGPVIEGAPGATLAALSPSMRGMPAREDWEKRTRPLKVYSLPAKAAIDAFDAGAFDLLLNGRLEHFPLVELGPLSRGAIQIDPALGIFGLVFRSEEGFFADPARREALSMALDRSALLQPFGLGGWQPSTWIVPPALLRSGGLELSRWSGLSLEERRRVAAERVSAWRAGRARADEVADEEASNGEPPIVRVALPEGPGSDLLFERLAAAWSIIGVEAVQAQPGEGADLALRDRLARYSSPRWFLNQFHCELEIGLCAPEADALVEASLKVTDPLAKEAMLAEAHAILIARDAFIPIGQPVRWALVRGAIDAFEPNPWGLHPLFPLSSAQN